MTERTIVHEGKAKELYPTDGHGRLDNEVVLADEILGRFENAVSGMRDD